MKFSTETKHFTPAQNTTFIAGSLLPVWLWMFISAEVDKGNDRGLLTSVGMTLLSTLILAVFFSNNKIIDFFKTLCYLLLSGFIVLLLSVSLGFYIGHITKIDWLGLIVPIVSSGILMFYMLRRLFSFPDNIKAFCVILSLPLLMGLIMYVPFYDGMFAHKYGIGLPIAAFLSLLFISIAILCHKK